ncbi:hypothetical protein ILUMI_02360 [Ignelater luminosus]|uniref:Uncharacterized protein n=1 Tax=Ignelater luminosus TaxID=2038154 RepID=A0A8K0GN85_IGNLU|nr:hypothetical protein ILUMI_02360 [Ignelater luminosus]
MNTSLEEASSSCAVSSMYNLEMILDLNSSSNAINYDTFMNYTGSSENGMPVSNTPSDPYDAAGNSYSNKENLNPADIFNRLSNRNNHTNKEDTSKIFLSNGIYIHPVILNGNYKDITELIDVAPNQTSEESISKADSEFTKAGSCNLSFQKEYSTNNCVTSSDQNENNYENVSFNYDNHVSVLQQKDENCLKTLLFNNGINGTLHFLNTSNYQINSLPEYIDINSLTLQQSIIPSLLSSGQDYPEKIEVVKDVARPDNLNSEAECAAHEKKDDNNKEEGVEKIEQQQQNDEDKENAIEGSQSSNASDSSPPQSSARHRRKRRTFGEKRKNPVRKAQITKASLDLIEKLAIPPSVFNARIKRRKVKPNNVDMKNLRQSCRTSGAIYCPPGPLTKFDYREWPVDGMHERPFYNAETNTIIKYHIPVVNTETEAKGNENISEATPVQLLESSKEENISHLC